ncbi:hypothetical protein ACFW93_37375 [Streptomyces canus]|uniref:hypothetical protein n=1 Tax=Streptomyces canus TaxID=58343 RepID=UPI0036A10C3A
MGVPAGQRRLRQPRQAILALGSQLVADSLMEAVMGVNDSDQERTIPSGGQGTRVSGPRVLVAGASIGGPALAHWLRRRGPR